MTTRHKLRATLPHGPKDLGAEIEAEIAFTFLPGGKPSFDDPGWGHEIELIDAALLDSHGKRVPWANPRPFSDYSQAWLNELAREWLESDEGRAAALEEVAAELQEARVFIAALRRES